mgnify:CR=1 FL=1
MNNLEENNMQNSDFVSPIENGEVLTHAADNELNDEVEAVNPFVLEERFLSIWESMSEYMKNYLYINLFYLFLCLSFSIFVLLFLPSWSLFDGVRGANIFSLWNGGQGLNLIVVALLAYPLYALWKSSRNLKLSVKNLDEGKLAEAICYQKSFWKYLFIFCAVIIGLVLLVFVMVILSALFLVHPG